MGYCIFPHACARKCYLCFGMIALPEPAAKARRLFLYRFPQFTILPNAIILPYALRQNKLAIEERMVHLSKVLGLQNEGTDAIIDYILDLRKELNIPHTLREIGIEADNAKEIGEMAFKDPSTPSNARLISALDLEQLFKVAVSGSINTL